MTRPSARRVRALLVKDLLELRRTPAAWLPGVLMLAAMTLPFVIALLVPALTGDELDDADFREAMALARLRWPELGELSAVEAVQAFLFQQFLLLLLLVPVGGSLSLAAHGIVGEKQARSLEPLLATPVRTDELLVAKVLAAFVPALALELVGVVLYFGGIRVLTGAGVAAALATPRTLAIMGLLAPMAALIALQLAVMASARATDARSAQQIGTLVILPLVGLMVAQFSGAFWLATSSVVLLSLAMAIVWVALVAASVALFRRESILTRWR